MDKTIKTAIVEDNAQCSDLLIELLQEHAKHISVEAVLDNFESAHAYLSDNCVDLLFLDMELGDEYGIDIIRQLPEVDFKIIVTTAYDKYALEAFNINAIHYLLKPVSANALKDALTRVDSSQENINEKLLDLQVKMPATERLQVSTDDGIYFINPQNITCIMADGSYSIIRTNNGQKLVVSHLLKKYEYLLSLSSYYRVSRSAIINLKHLIRYKRYQGGTVELACGTELVIPRRKREEFSSYLDKLFGNLE